MRATVRHLPPGEPDLELLALGGSAGAVAWRAAWITAGLPLPHCAFRAMTGCPCPTCGATRCVLALLHGHAGAALAWNPLVFCGLAAIAVLNLYAAAVLAGRFPPGAPVTQPRGSAHRTGGVPAATGRELGLRDPPWGVGGIDD